MSTLLITMFVANMVSISVALLYAGAREDIRSMSLLVGGIMALCALIVVLVTLRGLLGKRDSGG